jgi:CheY-like chemotaxis protein
MNGQAALDAVKQNVQSNGGNFCNFYLIFMDQNMPILDGCDSTLQIRDFLESVGLPQPLIIGVTGQTEEAYVQRAYKNGMNAVSSKPIDIKMIEKVLLALKFID